jgi:hypothetical protein
VELQLSQSANVKKCRNCGVEMEKFLKILWKLSLLCFNISQAVKFASPEKVEIIFSSNHIPLCCENIYSTCFSTLC